MPTLEGHRIGIDKIQELMSWAQDAGIEEVTVYAFSTENWNRAAEEVAYLMELFERACSKVFADVEKSGARVRFIGERTRFSKNIQEKMRLLEERSSVAKRGTLVVALSYGGRPEILAAVNALLASCAREADEKSFRGAMWSAGLLDPDLIIRTGGDRRLSNFLTWQSAYSELFFTETKWPDFSKEEFERILGEYASRERRLGK
jgi:undecaprenyl diphosphate synthase